MGLFGKDKLCLACGAKTGGLRGGSLIDGGWLCKDCQERISPYVEMVPLDSPSGGKSFTPFTVDEYRAHLAWREDCKQLDAVFNPVEVYTDITNGETIFEVDRARGLFRVVCGNDGHADVMRLADVQDVHAVVVEYIEEECGDAGAVDSRTHFYFFHIGIAVNLPLMRHAEFPAVAGYVHGGMDRCALPGGYGPVGKTTMSEQSHQQYDNWYAECYRLSQMITGTASQPILRVTGNCPRIDWGYRPTMLSAFKKAADSVGESRSR